MLVFASKLYLNIEVVKVSKLFRYKKLANASSLKTFRLRKLIGHESKNWVEFKLFCTDEILITTFLDLYERRTTFF